MSMTPSMAARGRTMIKPNEPPRRVSSRRDPRIPPPSSIVVNRVMKANRPRDTKPELQLRSALKKAGLKGYRTNWPGVPGRPDIAFPPAKLAVFVHGCFWHRCPRCDLPLPRTNRGYWQKHFRENQKRDKTKLVALKAIGWRAVVQWECEIEEDTTRCVRVIRTHLSQSLRPRTEDRKA